MSAPMVDFTTLRALYPPSQRPAHRAWRRIAVLRVLGHQGPYVWHLNECIDHGWADLERYVDQITAPMYADEIGEKYGAGQYRVAAYEWHRTRQETVGPGAVAVARLDLY